MMGGSGSGGSSRTSPSSGSGVGGGSGGGGGNSTGPSGGMMGGSGSGGSSRTAPSTSKSPGSNSKPSGGFSQSQFGSSSPKVPGSSMAASKAYGGAAKDAAARKAADASNSRNAQKNPGFKADNPGRSAIAGVTKDKSKGIADGNKIKGAISGIKQTAEQNAARAKAISRGPGVVTGAIPGTLGNTTKAAQRQAAIAIGNSMREDPRFGGKAFGPGTTVSKMVNDVNRMARTTIGEAGTEGLNPQTATTNAMLNRLALGQGMAGFDANGMDRKRTGGPNSAYSDTVSGTPAMGVGLASIAGALSPVSNFSTTAPANVLTASHYLTPAAERSQARRAEKVGVTGSTWSQSDAFKDTRTPYGSHVFGNADPGVRGKIAATRTTTVPTTTVADAPRPRARPSDLTDPRRMAAATYTQPYDVTTPAALVSPQKRYNDRVPASVPSFSETPFGGPRMRSLATATPEERANLALAQRRGNPTSAPTSGPIRASVPKQINDRVSETMPSFRSATQIAAGFPAGVQAPRPSSMRSATQIAAGLPSGAGTPSPSSMRSATEIAAGLPPGVQTPRPSSLRSATEMASGIPRAAEPSYPRSEYSGYGATGYSTLAGVPAPDGTRISPRENQNMQRPAGGYDPLGSISAPKAPAAATPPRPDIDKAPGPQPGEAVLADALKNAVRTENTYKVDLSFVEDKKVKDQFTQVFKNPDSIFDVAKVGNAFTRWSAANDEKALAKVRDGINDLKAMGAKVNKDGTISIPAAAAEKAQKVFNDMSKAYSDKFGNNKNQNPAYGKTFSEGIGSLVGDPVSEKVNKTPANVTKDAQSFLSKAQAEGKISRPVPSMNAFMPNTTRQSPSPPGTRGPGASMAAAAAPKTAVATPATGWGGPLSGIQAPNLGEMKVSVPTKGPNGEAINEVSTIDNYVDKVPGLNSEQKAALRRSMMADAADGILDFTTVDMNQKIAEVKAGDSYPVTESAAADPAFANSLIGDEAYNAAKETSYFPRNIFSNDTFLNDPTQQGMLRESVTPDITEMTKLHNRQRAVIAANKYNQNDIKPYLTKGETARAAVSNVVRNVFNINPLSRIGRAAIEKTMNIEDPKTFLSRPAYEQRALYQYANAAKAKREGSPVPEAGYPQGIPGGGVLSPGGGIPGSFNGDLGSGRNSLEIDGSSTTISDLTGSTPGETSGGASGGFSGGDRPYIYYEWDLGVNIPSPGDPKYTMYMVYLTEREAAAEKLYGNG